MASEIISRQPSHMLRYAIIAILFLLIIVGGGFFLGYQSGRSSVPLSSLTVTPKQIVIPSAATPTFIPITPLEDPTKSWTLYTNRKAGYTIKFPPAWKVKISELDPLPTGIDYITSLQAYPSQSPYGTQDPNAVSVDIDYPISPKPPHTDVGKLYEFGLKGLEQYSVWGPDAVQYAFYVKVDNKPALTVKAVAPATPVAGFGAQWCDHCTNKYDYVQLGDGRIITIEAFWGKNQQDAEGIFDKVVNTIHFQGFY